MAVIFLILLDQVLKISINMFFKTTEIHIWNNFLGFKVFLNCNHISMFNGYAINFKLKSEQNISFVKDYFLFILKKLGLFKKL